jgi:stage III sporulation protein AD
MVKVALIGVLVTFLSLLFKRERGEYTVLLGIAAGFLMFSMVLSQVGTVLDFLEELMESLPIEKGYLAILLKLLGITYIAEFASSICKDAGYGSLAGQIELFAKISILALGVPGVSYVLKLLDAYLG